MPKILKYAENLKYLTLHLLNMIFTQYAANVYTYQSCITQLWYYLSSFSLKNKVDIQKSSKLRVKTTSVSSEKSKT